MSPFFSVCVPVYNGLEYLADSINSILKQSFKNFEIVVVDDSSTDGSFEFIRNIAQSDNRFRYFRNDARLGLVGNWNECIKNAKGDWIKFLFQDDIWYPDCLQEVYKAACGNALVLHSRDFIIEPNADKGLRSFYSSQTIVNNTYLTGISRFTETQISKIIGRDPGFNFFGEPSNVAFKREITEKIGLFDSRLAQLCDYEYWCRIAVNYGGYYIDQRLSSFRVHGQSASSSNLAFKRLRFDYLDRLIVLHEFSTAPVYIPLRLSNGERAFQKHYTNQFGRISNILAKYSRAERREIQAQIAQYAPFAAKAFASWSYVRFQLVLLIKWVLRWFR